MIEYLGKPWIVGANGPDAFDCWGLLEDIYEKQKGIRLSRYNNIRKEDKIEVSNAIAKAMCIDWQKLDKPVHLCAVGLSNLPHRIFHVGCFIQKNKGYVIHTEKKSGCVIEPLDKIISKWKYVSFYGLRQHNIESV